MKPILPTRPRKGLSLKFIVAVCCTLALGACSNGSVLDNPYSLTDEVGGQVRFPDDYRGKTLVVSYIYTHCPSICVVTTDGMERLRDRLGKRDDVVFVSITLDPRRDSAETLRRYAEMRGIDTRSWHFLTGDRDALDSLFREMGVLYRTSFMERSEKGDEVYFIDHNDVVTLIDRDGNVRGEFKGTELDVEHVAEEINEIS